MFNQCPDWLTYTHIPFFHHILCLSGLAVSYWPRLRQYDLYIKLPPVARYPLPLPLPVAQLWGLLDDPKSCLLT